MSRFSRTAEIRTTRSATTSRRPGLRADVGADFVDIKHCHGYLLHEFLGAFTRPGLFGGSFENRTRILREIVEGIRADGNKIEIGVRLSAFDTVPFRPDPSRAQPGKPGPGIPDDFPAPLPLRIRCQPTKPAGIRPEETYQFAQLCASLGIKILNLTAGSPYYFPHVQRPAAYPPSDGYQPPQDPLVDVARQVDATRQVKATRARRPCSLSARPIPTSGVPAPGRAGRGAQRLGRHGRHRADGSAIQRPGGRVGERRINREASAAPSAIAPQRRETD